MEAGDFFAQKQLLGAAAAKETQKIPHLFNNPSHLSCILKERREAMAMARLLIVDDEMRIRELIKKYAKFEGYEVDEAADGMEA